MKGRVHAMLNIIRRTWALPLAFIATLAFVACGGNSSMLTGASGSGGATIMGTVNPGATASSRGEVRAMAGSSGITVTVTQTGQATQTDSSGRFVLTNLPAGSVTLRFTGRGMDAQLEISGLEAGQTLTITVNVSGSHADLDSSEKSPSSPEASCFAPGAKAEVEGKITGKTASSITVEQEGKGSFVCMITPSTTIRKGNGSLTQEDLDVGDHVHVSGTGRGESGGTCMVDATEIKLQ
jgi:carboxypeptidase family protein